MSLAVLSLLLAAPATADEAALARRLVERIEQRHASTRDLVARFVQGYRSGRLGGGGVGRGTGSIDRPGAGRRALARGAAALRAGRAAGGVRGQPRLAARGGCGEDPPGAAAAGR